MKSAGRTRHQEPLRESVRADRARCGKQVLPLQLRSPDDDRPRGGAECLRVYQSHENGPSRTLFSCEPNFENSAGSVCTPAHVNVCASPHCLRLVSSSTMCTCNKWCASELQRAHCIPGARTVPTAARARTRPHRSPQSLPQDGPSRRHVHRDHTEISILYHHRPSPRGDPCPPPLWLAARCVPSRSHALGVRSLGARARYV